MPDATSIAPNLLFWNRAETVPAADTQARIMRALVERVVVGPAGADIRTRLDELGGLIRDLTAIRPDAVRAAA